MPCLVLDESDLKSSIKGHAVAEGVSEGRSASLIENNAESSSSRKAIFETTESRERKQILIISLQMTEQMGRRMV